MINDYTRSVKSIKLEHLHIFKQIEDILKPQTVRQHQTEIQVRSELRPTPLTANEISQGMLDGWGFEKQTKSHESQEFIDSIEAKNKFPCDSWQVGQKKSHEDPLVFQHGESFTPSR